MPAHVHPHHRKNWNLIEFPSSLTVSPRARLPPTPPLPWHVHIYPHWIYSVIFICLVAGSDIMNGWCLRLTLELNSVKWPHNIDEWRWRVWLIPVLWRWDSVGHLHLAPLEKSDWHEKCEEDPMNWRTHFYPFSFSCCFIGHSSSDFSFFSTSSTSSATSSSCPLSRLHTP